MANCAIVGINWGDEGKGRMVDLLTENYDVVVRFQGGGNAGHTVVNEKGKFALHLLPSGIFRDGVVNILGNGVALDPESLWGEMCDVMEKGVALTPDNLKISDRASLLLPWHRRLDELEEARLADKKYGSTKQGIAPFYSDKYQKKTVLAGELFYPEELKKHLLSLMEWKNLTLTGVYGASPCTEEELEAWVNGACEKIKPYVCDTGAFLKTAKQEGKNILFEAQLGSLRDLDYGICPYTTSSNTTAAYAPIGSGLPSAKIDDVIGVVKAYSTCVGEGPFVCEMFGDERSYRIGNRAFHYENQYKYDNCRKNRADEYSYKDSSYERSVVFFCGISCEIRADYVVICVVHRLIVNEKLISRDHSAVLVDISAAYALPDVGIHRLTDNACARFISNRSIIADISEEKGHLAVCRGLNCIYKVKSSEVRSRKHRATALILAGICTNKLVVDCKYTRSGDIAFGDSNIFAAPHNLTALNHSDKVIFLVLCAGPPGRNPRLLDSICLRRNRFT